jgi:hypothetical protein
MIFEWYKILRTDVIVELPGVLTEMVRGASDLFAMVTRHQGII